MKSFYLNLMRYRVCVCARHTMQLDLVKTIAARKQYGFSLLELVVVIALLSIVALASTSLIIDNGDLKRQQETESRWNQIHDAIISPPNLYLNGSPYVRGYVADMGRLPVSILELIQQRELGITYDEDNDGGATTPEITIDQPDFQAVRLGYTAAAGYEDDLSGGWRGPYLYTAGQSMFRDGWGREDADLDQDAFNFGWDISLNPGESYPTITELYIHSFGSDQDPGGAGDFTEDFPLDAAQAIVSANEWVLSGEPITFNINFSTPLTSTNLPTKAAAPGVIEQLVLRIFRYVDNGDNTAEFLGLDDVTDDFEVISADAAFSIEAGDPTSQVQTITPMLDLPIGRYAALVYCTNVPITDLVTDPLANASDDVVYDGDCDYDVATNPINHSPVYFTLTNNTSQVTLTWDLP